jgi:hypothetical protein
MAANRWKIPLDASGSLENVYKWPWYWRYPIAFVGAVASFAFFLWIDSDHPGGYIQIVLSGLWLLISLSVARELLFFLIGGGVLWLGYAGISDSNWHVSSEKMFSFTVIGAGIYLLIKVDEMRKTINQLKHTQSVMEMDIHNLQQRGRT